MDSKSSPVADPGRWAALVVMLAAAFMNLFDVSIVNIAVPYTGFQVGGSIGLAVIGVIFFGFLGSQAAPAVASTVTPPACRADAVVLPAAAGRVLASSAAVATKRDFTAVTEHALWYQAGVFALAFGLMTALPPRRRHKTGANFVQRVRQRALRESR